MSSEVEESLKRIGSHSGVVGTIVVNSDGIVRNTFVQDGLLKNHANGSSLRQKWCKLMSCC